MDMLKGDGADGFFRCNINEINTDNVDNDLTTLPSYLLGRGMSESLRQGTSYATDQ
jgi:hypothetical protein